MHDSLRDIAKISFPATVAATSLAGYRWDTLSYQLAALCSAFVIIQQVYRLYQWIRRKFDASKYPDDATGI